MISNKDKEILRALAGRQAELAATDGVRALYRDWEAHGAFRGQRPMIRIELWTFEGDILPQRMRCEGQEARAIERQLLSNIVNYTEFGDDTLVPAYFGVPVRTGFLPLGIEPRRVTSKDDTGAAGLGFHIEPTVIDLEEDFHLFKPSPYSVDEAATDQRIEQLSEWFGDLLPVKRISNCLGASPMGDVVRLMGMENMFVAMYDAPEKFHRMMEMLTEDYCKYFAFLESSHALRATTKDEHLNQGTYCFTDELPDKGADTQTRDMWLYLDSQETSGVSPRMYKEFTLPYYKVLAARCGFLSYGCCEAVHEIWDDGLDGIPNLRKLSISPWCDERFIGERLRGKKIVYLRKPTPNLLGVGSVLDEEAVRQYTRATAEAASGCTLEIAQRDVYEIGAGAEKVRRYVELIRETLDKYWRK